MTFLCLLEVPSFPQKDNTDAMFDYKISM